MWPIYREFRGVSGNPRGRKSFAICGGSQEFWHVGAFAWQNLRHGYRRRERSPRRGGSRDPCEQQRCRRQTADVRDGRTRASLVRGKGAGVGGRRACPRECGRGVMSRLSPPHRAFHGPGLAGRAVPVPPGRAPVCRQRARRRFPLRAPLGLGESLVTVGCTGHRQGGRCVRVTSPDRSELDLRLEEKVRGCGGTARAREPNFAEM
jgi:hypothetical protein